MKTIVIALAATLALGACAQSPDAITPVSMGNAFASVSCRQAQGDLMTERQSLATLSAQQNGAVIGDAVRSPALFLARRVAKEVRVEGRTHFSEAVKGAAGDAVSMGAHDVCRVVEQVQGVLLRAFL
jgi:hypothetical protein